MSEGRHGQNVRDEVPRQEAYKDETGGNFGAQREDNALSSQYWSKPYLTMYKNDRNSVIDASILQKVLHVKEKVGI